MAYDKTNVSVSKSREGITKVLQAWGARGIQWEDDLESAGAVLRFRWKRDGKDLVARLNLDIDRAGIGKVGTGKRENEIARRQRQIHRVTYWWLKAQGEAIAAGLFEAEAAILPWIEDASGATVSESMLPHLGELGTADVRSRMMLKGGA